MKSVSLWASFGFAWQGLVYAFRSQRNVRIHTGIALCAVAVGLWVGLDTVRWAIIVLTIALVLVTELLNTALEAGINMATREFKPLAKTAKDVAAGAVMLAAVLAVIVGLLILGPPLWVRVMGR